MKNTAIRENHLYKKTYLCGKKAVGRFTVIYFLKDKKAFLLKKQHPQKKYVNRIGLTVGKKLGGAVQRNRAKRVIRAALAMCEKESPLKKGNLIVITAREASVTASSLDIYEEMKKQLQKLGLAYTENTETVAPESAESPKNSVPESFENIQTVAPESAESPENSVPESSENIQTAAPGSAESPENSVPESSENIQTVAPESAESPENSEASSGQKTSR